MIYGLLTRIHTIPITSEMALILIQKPPEVGQLSFLGKIVLAHEIKHKAVKFDPLKIRALRII